MQLHHFSSRSSLKCSLEEVKGGSMCAHVDRMEKGGHATAPLLVEEQLEVLVGEGDGGVRPGALEAAAVGMAASQCMRATQRHNLLLEQQELLDQAWFLLKRWISI